MSSPTARGSLRSAVARWLDTYVHYGSADPADLAAFARHRRRITSRTAFSLAMTVFVAMALTWPTDILLFSDEPDIIGYFSLWRGAALVFTAGYVVLSRVIDPASPASTWNFSVFTALIFASAGYSSGLSGGLDRSFFYPFYGALFLPTLVLVPLGLRLALESLFCALFLGFYFLPTPANLDHPDLYAVLLSSVCGVLFATVVGQVIHHLSWMNFSARRALRDKAAQLEEAHKQSEALLLNILPGPVAERLKQDSGAVADGFAEVTVLFADIVGFTRLSDKVPPEDLVETLNRFFSGVDELADRLGVEKIKTIGDCYMAAAGLPEAREDHAAAAAELALEMVALSERHELLPGQPLTLRVGLHTGPVVAGVIGRRKFIYDLWGDTVNIASRMESLSAPGCIQVTEAVRARLEGTYLLEPRGAVDVKGKGPMPTWWLRGRRGGGGPSE